MSERHCRYCQRICYDVIAESWVICMEMMFGNWVECQQSSYSWLMIGLCSICILHSRWEENKLRLKKIIFVLQVT